MILNEQVNEKSPRKTTPKKTTPRKTTPKKNGMNNLTESEDASPPGIPNLRLEAKLTAEVSDCVFGSSGMFFVYRSTK